MPTDDHRREPSAGRTPAPAAPSQAAPSPRERFPLRQGVNPRELRPFGCDETGAYRWEYRVNTFSNPSVLINLMWVVVITAGLLALVMLIRWLADGCRGSILNWLGFIPVGSVCTMLLFSAAWAIVMWLKGPGAIADYVMEQRKLSYVTNSIKSGKRGIDPGEDRSDCYDYPPPTTYDYMDIDYTKVRRIKAVRRRNLIWVNLWMQRGAVYVPAEQYEFVYRYITSRCQNAKIK